MHKGAEVRTPIKKKPGKKLTDAENGREIVELKKTVAEVLRRAGIGDDILPGHEFKKAKRKRSDGHKPEGVHPHHERD